MRATLPAFDAIWQQQLKRCLIDIAQQWSSTTRLVLGCSGGEDSLLLLYVLAALFAQRLQVVTVDHQLQAESERWTQHVQAHCQSLNVPCEVVKVQVAAGNTEAQARQARYAAFEQQLQQGDVLVLAHHQQDQAETVLLRLVQGTGVAGLAAMLKQQERTFTHKHGQYQIWRPFLDVDKERIRQWVAQLGLDYVHDPMNEDPHYARVWCRQRLLPLLTARYPAAPQAIARCATLMQDAQQILHEVLQQDSQACIQKGRLDLKQLSSYSLPRQRQVLSYWLQAEGHYRPPLTMVERLQHEVIHAKPDAQACLVVAGWYFVRFQQHLYRYPARQWQSLQALPQVQSIIFSRASLQMTALGAVTLRICQVGLADNILNKPLQLRPRLGGEIVQRYGKAQHSPLKKQLHAAGIAPWLRKQSQLLYDGEQLLGVFTAQGFWLMAGTHCVEQGWQPCFVDQIEELNDNSLRT